MEVRISNYHPYRIIEDIGSKLDLELQIDCLEKYILLKPPNGKGKISAFEFSDGIGLIVVSGILLDDWTLLFSSENPAPLIFKFSIEGGIFHKMDNGNISYHLNIMQGSITANTQNQQEIYRLPSNKELTYAMILMDRKKYLDKIDCYVEELPEKLQEVINDTQGTRAFFYEGNYSVGVMDCVQDINKDANLDLVRAVFIEGKTLELLSKLFKQYRDDLKPNSKQVLLRKYDLDKVLMAKEILISNLQSPPTIQDLSRIVGINQTKLKKGFKQVFDQTIKAFIIKQRLEKAKLLLLQNKYSIQEIANEVGYSNSSHFSRLFKRNYGVLPKDFSKQILLKIEQSAEQ